MTSYERQFNRIPKIGAYYYCHGFVGKLSSFAAPKLCTCLLLPRFLFQLVALIVLESSSHPLDRFQQAWTGKQNAAWV